MPMNYAAIINMKLFVNKLAITEMDFSMYI